ncbi:hypothetical protein FBZ94_110147 [Bradyrhizobium sacchari]|uniref:Uncharacterized protein n=1 Tax=Bradyrhizobium sacchari TaxID=1399419 RepID=A0A560JEB4_9BRAD|nr:hypothetical protein FBZ94_110147 [Bradyrhizobium sacchari]TWB69551.1 hypothetical protein FBZ95_109147 [Bradyrhizobium sacchari]
MPAGDKASRKPQTEMFEASEEKACSIIEKSRRSRRGLSQAPKMSESKHITFEIVGVQLVVVND